MSCLMRCGRFPWIVSGANSGHSMARAFAAVQAGLRELFGD